MERIGALTSEVVIAYLVEFYRPTISGVIRSVDAMCQYLIKIGFWLPILFAPWVIHKDKSPLQVVRVPSIPLGLHAAIAWPILWPGLLKKLRRLNVRLIHLHSAYTLGLLGLKLKKALGIPCVVQCHTDIVATCQCFFGWPLRPIARLVALYLFKRLFGEGGADHIIAPSQFTKRSLIEYGIPDEKITVMPTPVEAPKIPLSKEEMRVKLGLPLEKTLLVYVGRMSADKNLVKLLQSFEIVLASEEAILVLVGGGLYARKLQYLVWQMGLSEKVIFVGPVSYDVVYDYDFASDIFVFTGTHESQGLGPLEAGSVGTPAVVVSSGGVKEYVNSDWAILTEDDPAQFAEAVIRLIRNPRLREILGANGKKFIREKLSPEVVYAPLRVLYSLLMGDK